QRRLEVCGVRLDRLAEMTVCLFFLAMTCAPVVEAAAPAAITLESTNLPVRPDGPDVRYTAQVVAGRDGAEFGIEFEPDGWGVGGDVAGSPVRIVEAALEGSGSIREASQEPLPPPVLHIADTCEKSVPSYAARSYWIDVPPNATTRFVVR